MKYERVQMPSGLVISHEYLVDGSKTRETHSYGALIGITYNIVDGERRDEVYIFKGRAVSASIYERERRKFPDLPAAGVGRNLEAELEAEIRRGHSDWLKSFRQHVANKSVGDALDLRLSALIAIGDRVASVDDFKKLGVKIGAHAKAQSARIIKDCFGAGARSVVLVEPDQRTASIGAIIIELPEVPARSDCFIIADLHARRGGYTGDFDDGQKYLYVRMT